MQNILSFFRNKNAVIVSLLVLVLLAAGSAYYFYSRAAELADPQAVAAAEAAALVEEVGALIVLPEGETPTVATVTDPERLRDQAFFANAKAGDKVLLYSTARKAYLYDPVSRKLIDVAPLNIGSDQAPE